MLKLYYARPSLYARPVWLALLEKQLHFELVPINLSGDRFEPEFLGLNPFRTTKVCGLFNFGGFNCWWLTHALAIVG